VSPYSVITGKVMEKCRS